MGTVYGFLFIVAGLALWAFLKFRPKYHDNPYQIDMFNRMVLGVCAMMCIAWYVGSYIYLTRIGLPEHRNLVGILGVIGIEVLLLSIFFYLRNFWIFKSRSYRPGGFL